jgi:hypothetical protein
MPRPANRCESLSGYAQGWEILKTAKAIIAEKKLVRARHEREHTKKRLLLLESRVNKENEQNGVNSHDKQVEAFSKLNHDTQEKLLQLKDIRRHDRQEEAQQEKYKILKAENPTLCPLTNEENLHRKVTTGLKRCGLTELFGLQNEVKMVVTQSDKRRFKVERIRKQFNDILERIKDHDPYCFEVDLQNMEIDDDMMKILSAAMALNYSVRKVNLNGNRIGQGGASQLSRIVSRCHSLMVLLLGSNNIDDLFIQTLCRGLKANTGLRELNLVGRKVPTNDFKKLEHKRNFGDSKEQEFQFAHSMPRITAWGAVVLANTLRKNSSLIVLALGTHEIGDEGCGALADLLANNHTLEQLEIDNNLIGSEGGRKLAHGLERNTSLTVSGHHQVNKWINVHTFTVLIVSFVVCNRILPVPQHIA